MKHLAIAGAAIAGTVVLVGMAAGPARAQMGPPMVDWSGPYLGVEGGGQAGSFSGSAVHLGPTAGTPASTAALNSSFGDSFTVGGLFGYNFQQSHMVYGIEGDVKWDNLSRTTTLAGPGLPRTFVPGDNFKVNEGVDGSVRARVGYAWDRALVYGTAGVAFADAGMSANFIPIGIFPASSGNSSHVLVGGTVGVGAEYMVAPNVSLGAEYRFTDYGNDSSYGLGTVAAFHTGAGAFLNANVTGRTGLEDHRILARIAFHFGAPPPPPPAVTPMPVVAPMPPPQMARTFLVFFDFDKYNLTPDARRVIEAAAASFKATGVARIEVSGYTDLAGTQAYNLRLSQRRADAVSLYLMHQGVPKNVLDLKWFGKEHPRVPTPDGVREPQNRRVEIMMP